MAQALREVVTARPDDTAVPWRPYAAPLTGRRCSRLRTRASARGHVAVEGLRESQATPGQLRAVDGRLHPGAEGWIDPGERRGAGFPGADVGAERGERRLGVAQQLVQALGEAGPLGRRLEQVRGVEAAQQLALALDALELALQGLLEPGERREGLGEEAHGGLVVEQGPQAGVDLGGLQELLGDL